MQAAKRLGVLCLIAVGVGVTSFGQALAGVKVVGWVKYADVGEEWKATREILEAAGATVVETSTTDPSELLALLRGVDILLIPEQEDGWESSDLVPAGQKLAPAFLEFLRGGGRIVSLDYADGGNDLLRGAGLTSANDAADISGEDLKVLLVADPVAAGIPSTFTAPNGTTDYKSVDMDAEVIVASKAGKPVVFRLRRHGGEILFLGFDFFRSNDATKALLVNACTRPVSCRSLDPGVAQSGTLGGKEQTASPEDQFCLVVPPETEHVLVQLDGNLQLHIRGGRAVGFTGERVIADLSLTAPGPKTLLISRQMLTARNLYFGLGNPTDAEQVYTLVAWCIPAAVVVTPPLTVRGKVEEPTIEPLAAVLRTEEGYVALVQYKVEVAKTPAALSLVLRSDKRVRGWVRYGEPVRVVDGKVMADFGFSDALTLTGTMLKPGTYFIAVEGIELPLDYVLTVELR